MDIKDEVTISGQEYAMLKADKAELRALYEAGVDNWEGYNEAMKAVYEDDESE
jgi:hypothetical protein